jgi:type IV secretory pathway VirB4 component
MLRLRDRPRLSDFLPWRFMLDDQTIVTRTGSGGGLMKVAHLVPRDLETAGPLAKDVYHHQLAELLGRLGGGWTLWIDQWRWRQPGYLPRCDFGACLAAQVMDEERRSRFASAEARVFDNAVFLTMHYNADRADRLFEYLLGKEKVGTTQGLIDRFDEACKEFLAELAQIFQRVELLEDRALGSYLSQCVNYEPWPAFVPSAWIAEHLGTATWRTGLRPMVNRNHLRTVELYTIGALTTDTLEALHMLPFECRWVVRIESLHREVQAREVQQLVGQFDQKRKSLLANLIQHWSGRPQADTNLTAVARKEDAQRLKVEIEMAELGYAKITCNVHTWHENEEQVAVQADHIETFLKGRSCRAEIAQLNATFAPLADIPGNWGSERELRALMAQVTRLTPVTGITRGAPTDAKWDGPALMMGNSARGLPIHFSFHSPGEDVGNTAIIGATGAGKSALIAHMALETMKYPQSRVLVFDRGRSFMPACLCAGGDWIELGEGGAGVQPLRYIDLPAQLAIAHDWLCKALRYNEVAPNDQIKQALTSALRLLARRPPDERTISGLLDRIGESREAKRGLAVYRADGPFGATFDSVVTSYGNSRVVGVECDAIMRLDVAPLAILATFNALRFERMRSGQPFAVFFDEAKAMLTHQAFIPEVDTLAREIRKANGVLVLASQSQADFDDSQLTRVIIDQMRNLIFLPNPDVLRPQTADFYRRIGLEDEHIRHIAEGRQKGEYFLVTPQYMRTVEIRLGGNALAICGRTGPRDKIMAQTILAEGTPPGEPFLRRWLEYANPEHRGAAA